MKLLTSLLFLSSLCLLSAAGWAQVTYLDADITAGTGNTTPSSAFAAAQGIDNLWGPRTGFGNGGNIFQSTPSGAVGEDAPEIVTTITGLTPGENYEVWVNFWDATNAGGDTNIWVIRAGFQSGNLQLFGPDTDLPTTATYAASLAGAVEAATVLTLPYDTFPLANESNRTLFAGYIGEMTADGSGNIAVYIDDLPSLGASDSGEARTWYDGVSYGVAGAEPEPTSDSLAMYLDADATAGTGNTVPDTAFATDQGIDNLWEPRTVFGNEGNIYQSTMTGNAGEDAPEITTTISGLTPGETYEVWVNFWDATDSGGAIQIWPIRAGFQSGNLRLFAPDTDLPTTASYAASLAGAIPAQIATSAVNYTTTTLQTLIVAEGNRTLFAGYVGRADADGSGNIAVYVDDLPSLGASDTGETRTWYDGLTYRVASPLVNAVRHWEIY